MSTTLFFALLCVAVRVADACGSENEWGNGHENNMLCPSTHRDGVPDGTCYGASAVPNGCCFAATSWGEVPTCSDPAYSVQRFDGGYIWGLGDWVAYGCCMPHVPYDAIIGGSVGGAVVLIAIIFGIYKRAQLAKSSAAFNAAQPHANVPQAIQMMPQAQPQQVHPQMQPPYMQPPVAQPQIPIAQVATPVMGNPQPKGRFDTNTGKENPRFDPETGVQNW